MKTLWRFCLLHAGRLGGQPSPQGRFVRAVCVGALAQALSGAPAALAQAGPAREPAWVPIQYANSAYAVPIWLQKMRSLAAGEPAVFRIVQLGDSHTGGGYFTDALRSTLQAAWGDAGPGWVFPAPLSGQRSGVVRYAPQGWQSHNSLKTPRQDYPAGGILALAQPNVPARMRISPLEPTSAQTRYRITALVRPVQVRQALTFADAQDRPVFTVPVPRRARGELLHAARSGPWQAVSFQAPLPLQYEHAAGQQWAVGPIGIENGQAGVTVSALGVNGAQLVHTQRWRPRWRDDLRHTRADLLILAFGTNEAFSTTFSPQQAQQHWQQVIEDIRTALPRAGILVLGAPDVLVAPASVPDAHSPAVACPRPPRLVLVQRLQRIVAEDLQAAFWPQAQAMRALWPTPPEQGQDCPAAQWQQQGLMGADGVHFSAAGYSQLGQALGQALLALARPPQGESEQALSRGGQRVRATAPRADQQAVQ